MVRLTKIYTRGGDKGKTSLGDGKRVDKHSTRVSAYGDVDEANAAVGVARLHARGDVDAALERIQNDLFDVGADLCVPITEHPEHEPLRVTNDQVKWLEDEIDRLNSELKPLKSFVLPGGTDAAAHLHHARTITRRAERAVSILREVEPINEPSLRYLNRLSDYLFVAARYVNRNEGGDVLWVPGANRER